MSRGGASDGAPRQSPYPPEMVEEMRRMNAELTPVAAPRSRRGARGNTQAIARRGANRGSLAPNTSRLASSEGVRTTGYARTATSDVQNQAMGNRVRGGPMSLAAAAISSRWSNVGQASATLPLNQPSQKTFSSSDTPRLMENQAMIAQSQQIRPQAPMMSNQTLPALADRAVVPPVFETAQYPNVIQESRQSAFSDLGPFGTSHNITSTPSTTNHSFDSSIMDSPMDLDMDFPVVQPTVLARQYLQSSTRMESTLTTSWANNLPETSKASGQAQNSASNFSYGQSRAPAPHKLETLADSKFNTSETTGNNSYYPYAPREYDPRWKRHEEYTVSRTFPPRESNQRPSSETSAPTTEFNANWTGQRGQADVLRAAPGVGHAAVHGHHAAVPEFACNTASLHTPSASRPLPTTVPAPSQISENLPRQLLPATASNTVDQGPPRKVAGLKDSIWAD